MRSSVFARAAIAMASLLFVSAAGVVAQSPEDMPPVHVTGVVTFDETDPFEPGTSIIVDGGATEFRGNSAVRRLTMSDERLSGSQRAVWNQYDYGSDGSTVAGRLSIENDGGSWHGAYQGVIFLWTSAAAARTLQRASASHRERFAAANSCPMGQPG